MSVMHFYDYSLLTNSDEPVDVSLIKARDCWRVIRHVHRGWMRTLEIDGVVHVQTTDAGAAAAEDAEVTP